jgi:ABC-type transport system involved in multi-copper enzyme maturation permease subunit
VTEAEAVKAPRRTLGERLRSNPVTLKELRGRMRGARAFLVLTIYVVLISAFTSLLYLAYSTTTGLVASSSGSTIGKIVFGGVMGLQLFTVCFIAPSFTAGAISGERERQTFELLRTTLLPARSLVMGKLGSALSYVLLLLVAGVPLQSLAFLMGGVTIEEVLLALLLLVVTAILFSTVGVFFSSLTRRTLAASVLTYSFALGMTLGLPLLFLIFIPVFDLAFYDIASPVIEAALIYGGGLLVATNPVTTVIATEIVLLEENSILFFDVSMQSSIRMLPLISPWIVYVVFAVILSLVMMASSVRLVKRPEK